MKKIIVLISCLMIAFSAFGLTSKDKVLNTKTTDKGISYTICQDENDEIYLLVTDKSSKKSELKVSVNAMEEVDGLIEKLDIELNSYKRTPLKKLIKSYKDKGSWEKDENNNSYFELDDNIFEDDDDDLDDDDLDDDDADDLDEDSDDESNPESDDTDDDSDDESNPESDDTDDDSDDIDDDTDSDDCDDDDEDEKPSYSSNSSSNNSSFSNDTDDDEEDDDDDEEDD